MTAALPPLITGRRIGRDFLVDLGRVKSLLDDGYLGSETATTATARLRLLAAEIDSQVAASKAGTATVTQFNSAPGSWAENPDSTLVLRELLDSLRELIDGLRDRQLGFVGREGAGEAGVALGVPGMLGCCCVAHAGSPLVTQAAETDPDSAARVGAAPVCTHPTRWWATGCLECTGYSSEHIALLELIAGGFRPAPKTDTGDAA